MLEKYNPKRIMIFISPHPDDETLFGAYTIMRFKPLVLMVTHPTEQGDNGNERLLETYEAMRILGSPVCFLGIPENELNEENLTKALFRFKDEFAFIPDLDGGHPHHDLIHNVCKDMFPVHETYKTYGKGETRAIGKEIIPTDKELEFKIEAMKCYKTQIENPLTNHYFLTTKEYA